MATSSIHNCLIRAAPRKSMAAFCFAKKKTGLVGPASSSVELRCGYITARRMLAPKVPPALFGQICSDATPRVSRKIGIAWTVFHLQTPFQSGSSSITR